MKSKTPLLVTPPHRGNTGRTVGVGFPKSGWGGGEHIDGTHRRLSKLQVKSKRCIDWARCDPSLYKRMCTHRQAARKHVP